MPSPDHSRTEARNTAIDLFRGLLLIAVVLGHFSELNSRGTFLTWLGYGFRMPLFMGLTGYMFNLDKARAAPPLTLLRRYFGWLILPWLTACIVQLTITGELRYFSIFYIFIRPPFHLWFVPVMMAFIVIARSNRCSPQAMLAFAIPVSIAAMYVLGVGHTTRDVPMWMPDKRFFIYPIYFFFGLWVAGRVPSLREQRISIVLALIGLLWWCRLYGVPGASSEVAAELILGLSLINLLPRIRTLNIDIPAIAGVGRDSLFFYLWHPMAFALLIGCGMTGLPMLLISLLLLLIVRALLSRSAGMAGVMGIYSRKLRAGSQDDSTVGVMLPERAA